MKQKNKYKLEEFPFTYKIKTRWKDLDAFGHVNNAVFATYIEDARVSLFKRWDLSPISGKKSVIAASLKIDFIKQLTHPSEIIIGQKISRIGTKSFDIHAIIYKEDSMICDTMLTCVCFDYIEQKSVKIFPEILADYSG